jgi:hypothetical protein
MSKDDIWYGFLEAGAKSSPVVRDMTLEAKNQNTVYLYNHARGMFLEYALEIVGPKLRELKPGDISQNELDAAFKMARKAFNPVKTVKKWSDSTPASPPEDSDESELAMDTDTDTSIDDFIDDDS